MRLNISLILPLCLLLLVLALSLWRKSGRKSRPEIQIIKAMNDAGLGEYGKFAVAVSKHETANFTSEIFLNLNNAFGIKTNDLSGYRKYQSVYESAQDFARWLQRKNVPPGLSLKGLIYFMKSNGYFEDNLENYYNGAAAWLRAQ